MQVAVSVGAPTCGGEPPKFGRIYKFSKCVALLFLRYHSVSIGHNESNQYFSGSRQSGDHLAARDRQKIRVAGQ